MPDRAQDTEAIRAALTRYGASVSVALAALDRLVARLEAAEQTLREWLAYTGLRQRAFASYLDPDDDEYASGRALIRKTDAALAAAAPGETTPTCGCGWPERDCVIRAWGNKPEENMHLECGERDAAPGETEQTP